MSQAKRFLVIGLAALTLPAAVCAQPTTFDHRGFYLGLLLGYSRINYRDVTLLNNIVYSNIKESGLAPNVQIGYDFRRWMALELGVIYMHKPRFNDSNVGPGETKIKFNVLYLDLKPRWFFKPKWYVYSKMGVGYVVNDTVYAPNNEPAIIGDQYVRPVYGAGFGWVPSMHWSVELGWMQTPANYSVQIPTANFVGAGAQYLF